MKSRPPRHAAGFSYIGTHRYSLTFCTYGHARVFTRADAVNLVLAQIQRAAAQQGFAVIAYCFMPDHVHLLVSGQLETSNCRTFIARAKQYSGFYYARAFNEKLWQRYGWERTLRDNELTRNIVTYIARNPVRGRLVRHAADYPFIGSSVYSRPQLLAMCGD